jgi:hypothetical protein
VRSTGAATIAPLARSPALSGLSGWAAAHAGTGYFPIFKEKKLEILIEKKKQILHVLVG